MFLHVREATDMKRLRDIGFEKAGCWRLVGGHLSFELSCHGSKRNILYAFVVDDEVKYIGKTVRALRNRMYGYKNPGESQSTNVKVHAYIKKTLREGDNVELFALPDNGLLHFGPFHVNLAAGLEDSIISELNPEWNGKSKDASSDEELPKEELSPVVDTFMIVLQPTYFNKGFFNVPVARSQSFADDGQTVEVFCGDSSAPITGAINRTANANRSPRIMGGSGLRDWFQQNVASMQEVTVDVYSPRMIRIKP